jgi:hypothetical protein
MQLAVAAMVVAVVSGDVGSGVDALGDDEEHAPLNVKATSASQMLRPTDALPRTLRTPRGTRS